ncbi:unnamed protein product (macronuclear) [Paramecium tetraurelia]|uniref:RGS domain-containing protein n=1 Tax=Paramecium tetraurelia TaxID=5888 RepID=A0BEP1_PARTE|nr:uncharacterized protein GSPATT00028041001 [Paramecium tetraurelia]CAK57008.1 unnamed protein product [Paramecium tetraurelia]|eukprot:XP_001424406.1 hypothetical protein (macronuclear) [Paramecium tetraurelia strain d4-2]
MNPYEILSEISTQENEENFRCPENFNTIMNNLNDSFEYSLDAYQKFSEHRALVKDAWIEKCLGKEEFMGFNYRKKVFLLFLEYLHKHLDCQKDLNSEAYAFYAQHYRNTAQYVNYAVEIPKIRHKIFELEVDWYIENISEDQDIVKNKHYPSIFQPILEQDPIEANHTRAVISHALEQLEAIAAMITKSNVKHYAKYIERYGWCLAGMVPLLPAQEQDPFQDNGIHQRWQKARNKIQEKEHQ